MTTDASRGRSPTLLAHAEEGQTIVLLAVALPMLLALLLVVIDGGRLYVERERLRGAAQLAAYAGTSAMSELPPEQQRDQDSARRSIDPVIREALQRNLPGKSFTYTFDMPLRDARSGGNLVVHVNSLFAASIQRITLGIGAMGTVTLAPPPTPTPAVRRPPVAIAPPAPRPTPAPTPTTAAPQATATPGSTASPMPIPSPAPTPWSPTVLATHELARAPNEVVARDGSVLAVLSGPGSGTGRGQLVTLDGSLSPSASLEVGAYPNGVAVDTTGRRAYIAHVYPPRLTVIDLTPERGGPRIHIVAEIPLTGFRGQKVEVDREAGRVYVTGFCDSVTACNDHAVMVFDKNLIDRGLYVGDPDPRIATITLDRRPDEILMDSAHRRAYVHEPFDGSLTFIDTSTNRVVRRVDLRGRSGGIALDQARDRLYSVDANTGTVTVLEGSTGRTVATLPVGVQAAGGGIALDPSTGRVYVSLLGPTRYDPVARKMVTENKLAAIDGLTGRLIGVAPMPGASLSTDLTFDQTSGRLYYTQGSRLSVVAP